MIDLIIRFEDLDQAKAVHQVCEMLQVQMHYRCNSLVYREPVMSKSGESTTVVEPHPQTQLSIMQFFESVGVRELPMPTRSFSFGAINAES